MVYKRKSWQEKFHNGHPEKIIIVEKGFADVPAGATMYIATPAVVDEYIRHIPYGDEISLHQMRKELAARHNAAYCCPVTSGIFLRIAAEAAFEAYMAGQKVNEITPFWRMIDKHSAIARKLSCGKEFIRQQRGIEGLPF